jgi:hypothetical protein
MPQFLKKPFQLNINYDLNPAIGKFAGDALLAGVQTYSILQVPGSKADSVKSSIPKGAQYKKKTIQGECLPAKAIVTSLLK